MNKCTLRSPLSFADKGASYTDVTYKLVSTKSSAVKDIDKLELGLTFFFALIMRLLVVTIVLGVLYKELTAVLGDIGTATSYGPPYIPTKCYGRSQEQFPPANMFVAVSDGLWDNGAACGRKYRLRCLSGNNKPCKDQTIDVQVVDACSKNPCQSNLVLSKDAFAAISRITDAKINIEYIQI